MTDDERKAMEWLDECCRLSPTPRVEYARTLKAMLARPVLPEKWSEDDLRALRDRHLSGMTLGALQVILDCVHAHLTAPKTKWEVYAIEVDKGGLFNTLDDALAKAREFMQQGLQVNISRKTVSA